MKGGFGRIQRCFIVSLSLLVILSWATIGSAETGSSSSAQGQKSEKADISKSKSFASTGASSGLAFDVAVRGGGLLPWDAPEEAGNAFGCSASLRWSDFRAGLSYGTALPDSLSQGLYHSVWAEFAWSFMGVIGTSRVRPYVLAGAGVAFADTPPEFFESTIRWNEETNLLGMLGLGARYGLSRGLYVAIDLRAYNLSFGGYSLSAGYTF